MVRALPPPFKLTPAAQAYLTGALAKNPQALGLRVTVRSAGCSGFKNDFSFCTAPDAKDREAMVDGIRFYLDPLAELHLTGATLDFVQRGLESKLEFTNNPNVAGLCGCGASYMPKNPDNSPKP